MIRALSEDAGAGLTEVDLVECELVESGDGRRRCDRDARRCAGVELRRPLRNDVNGGEFGTCDGDGSISALIEHRHDQGEGARSLHDT
jgi:hypothetical protein